MGKMYQVTPEMEQRLINGFTYHAPREDQIPRYEEIRNEAHKFALRLIMLTPASREQSLALTHLEDAVMCANRAIALNE